MPTFTITGEDDPFLHVALSRGESITCESDAMVMMEDALELSGRMQGGLLQSVMRRVANGESFFQQHIEAKRGDGDCILSPCLPGAMEILEIGPGKQYCLADESFVASTSGVQVSAQMQNIGTALFGGTGGMFIGRTSGSGQLVVSGFGSVFSIDVVPGKMTIVDNGHVVAWDSSLDYELSMATAGQNRGMLGNLVNSVTSGEGIVLKFSGRGRVIICSRNRSGFLSWLSSKIAPRS